jgi:glycosyltransferase involved in cell wall biosynthesis
MLTKDSLLPCLRESLDAIECSALMANITVRLIIVDKTSTDGTLAEIMRHEELSPSIIRDDFGNRATARQRGIEAVETDFFVFVDSDVILESNWFSKMLEVIKNPDVGAVWGYVDPIDPLEKLEKKHILRLYRRTQEQMTQKHSAGRGLTHDTIIRIEAVKSIQIPPQLHVWEDHYIRLHIENQGYKWINHPDARCSHARHTRTANDAYLSAYYGYRLGGLKLFWFFRRAFIDPIISTYLLFKTKSIEMLRIRIMQYINFQRAFVHIIAQRLM